ncbi:MAG: LamG-like jellyroll fold domain-containing protein [Cyclobacteriaceae bacterium]
MKNLLALVALLSLLFTETIQAQVLDPNDPIVEYDPNNPPQTPPSGTIAKWVITPEVNWNSDNWKSYILNGVAFRLRFPKNYNPNRSESYPMIVILHGLGFKDGDIYMNDRHLNNSGAKSYEDAINQNKFDGFVLSPQSTSSWFNEYHINMINNFVNQAKNQINLNVNRVSISGRSGGAQQVWLFIQESPKTYASAVPMSGVKSTSTDKIDQYKYTPLWLFQGELDQAPAPSTTEAVIQAIVNKKGSVRYTKYKEAGHGIFDKAYDDPDYFPFYERAHKANPTVLNGEYAQVFDDNKKVVYEFLTSEEPCPGDAINLTLGLTSGFDAYQWRKDGNIINGATSNQYVVTSLGVYEARIQRGSEWSEWSPIPVEVKLQNPTVTPDIQIAGIASKVLPALDGSNSVSLELPQGYAEYEWRKASNNNLVSTSRVFEATEPGNYIAKVTENFGCSSSFSSPFTVVNANGNNGPAALLGFNGYALSKTEVKVVWDSNPSDANAATGFELYRSESENGPYTFITLTNDDVFEYTDSDLIPNSTYFYKLRAVNDNAASPTTEVVSVKTLVDVNKPTAPTELAITNTTSFSISLDWNDATDDVGIYRYDVYRNDIKVLSVEGSEATIFNLQSNVIYEFKIKARDFTGNESPFSNRVVGITSLSSTASINHKFNGDFSDATANNTVSEASGNLSFSETDKVEGSASLSFTGGNPYLDVDINDQFIHDAFDQRSVAFWLKRNNSNGIQDVFDEGGSTNGFALRLNGGNLQFAVRNNNTQRTLSSPFPVGEWHHVTAIFNQGKIALYIDGSQVASNNNVPYNTIGDHGNDGGLGGSNSSNAFNQSSNNLNGFIDDFYLFSNALSQNQIDQLLDVENIVSIPDDVVASPENVTATALSYHEIQLEWDNAATNAVEFQLYRSEEGGPFLPIALLNANTTVYNDTELKAATTYTYKVVALSEYNESEEVVTQIIALANLKFNENLTDVSGNNTSTQASGNISYNASSKKEGTHAIQFNGNSYLDLDRGNQFIHAEFEKRSIAFWINSSNATGTQDVFDEGGSTNGIGIRFVNADLQLTVQNQQSIFSVQAPVTRNAWHHVVGIFDQGSLRLYIDGSLAAERNDVSYSTVNSHSDAAGLGGTNGSNAFDQNSSGFTGLIDDFYLFSEAVDDQVASIMAAADPTHQATTLPLPPAPNAPAALTATNVDYTEIAISFNDNSNNEEYFELWRSVNNNQNFQLIETLDDYSGSTISYTDENLQPHINYFYKVVAVNAGGSTESTVLQVSTLNHVPELEVLSDITIRHGVEYELQLYGTDGDGDALTVQTTNLPSFAQLTDYGDGSGLILFSPDQADQGSYPNIEIRLQDSFGGVATETFDLIVNSNFLPQLAAIANITIAEGMEETIALQASDEEGAEFLTWTGNLPDFATLTSAGDGSATLQLSPGFTDQGVYAATIQVTDADGGTDSESFDITVSGENPNTFVQVNFTDGSLAAGNGWNNTTGHPQQGDSYPNLTDINGNTTNFSLAISSNWNANGSNVLGTNTGNNSGIYPDNVLRSSYWTNNGVRTITIGGLDNTLRYNLTFFGSRASNDDRRTTYRIGSESVTLNAASNISQTVTISNVSPENNTITFTMESAGASSYGYLNALVIEEKYNTGNPPAAPTQLAAALNTSAGGVNITWNDVAFDELGYKVYKAADEAGPFEEIADIGQADATSYLDTDVSPNNTYYYQVSAYSTNGESERTETAMIVIPNFAPQIATINDLILAADAEETITITATDDAGDIITISAENLPSFATLTSTGPGTASLVIAPQLEDIGEYTNVKIIASDQLGEQSEEVFSIEVIPSNLTTYYVNFAGTNAYTASSPWNNYLGTGNAGDNLSGLVDNAGNTSGIALNLLDSWNGNNSLGMTGSSLYPDNVTQSSIWISATQNKRIRVSGLSVDMAYDFTFFGSRDGGGNRTTVYSINGTSVSLDASFNQNQVVSLEGVIPNSSGEVIITVNKGAGASYGYLNALVINGYAADAIPSTPTNLEASPLSSSSIQLSWQDNTNLETGYEIWRHQGNGTFTLLTTTAAGATGYNNTGLSKGVSYYYQVRAALEDGSYSDFSNIAAASTITSTVSINFNVTNPAAAPWNNTNTVPDPGLIFSNMLNEDGNGTGISFEIVSENPAYDPSFYGFSGDNPFGEITGDDSGVVPDNVMRSTYWMDPGKTSELRFFGLDLSQTYNFSFFASRDGDGYRTSVYTINGESVKLNAANNINNIVTLTNIVPDNNGEILVSITSDVGASFSYLGAIIIESANRIAPTSRYEEVASKTISDEAGESFSDEDQWNTSSNSVMMYPNPYNHTTPLTIMLPEIQEEELTIAVYDIQGSIVYEQRENKLTQHSTFVLEVPENILKSGLYMVRFTGNHIGTQERRLLVQ